MTRKLFDTLADGTPVYSPYELGRVLNAAFVLTGHVDRLKEDTELEPKLSAGFISKEHTK